MPAAAEPGSVLLHDAFDHPDAAILPRTSAAPRVSRVGYEDGEYVVQQVGAVRGRSTAGIGVPILITVPGEYQDASIALDARLQGQEQTTQVFVACRMKPEHGIAMDLFAGSYALIVNPDRGQFALGIWKDGVVVRPDVQRGRSSELIRPATEKNRIELHCVGRRISALINGTEVASFEDDTHRTGAMAFGVNAENSPSREGRFDNLVVTQR